MPGMLFMQAHIYAYKQVCLCVSIYPGTNLSFRPWSEGLFG